MLFFFKSIRKNLINNSSFTSYLIYALGELVLIVLGILIALKVDNINTYEQQRKREKILLTEMIQNLNMDLEDLNFNIEYNQELINSNTKVLDHLGGSPVNQDSLSIYYGNIFGGTVFIKNTSAFDNLKSIGLDLIKTDSLRQKITRIYSEKYPYIYHLEILYDQTVQLNHIFPEVTKKLVALDIDHALPKDLATLKEDSEFKEWVKYNREGKRAILYEQEDLKSYIESVKADIDKEL